jgi:hypothetical protein
MQITDAQKDARHSYVGGGPGAVVSGLVWLAAFIVAGQQGIPAAFTVLFFGGMLIFPLSLLVERVAFRRPKESPGNTMPMIALESTICMIAGLIAAWLMLKHAPHLTFPLAAIAVGTHYLPFKTLYGDRTYWVLGAVITLIGLVAIFPVVTMPGGTILAVALVEIAFGIWLTMQSMKEAR